ncbi:MAG: peptidase, partial [Frankiales bacterium]|nr:peptidase [Frankiales bacterium]
MDLTQLQHAVEARRPLFLTDLQELVDLDCGSHDKAGVDTAGRIVAARLESDGWAVQRLPHATYGDTLVATTHGGGGSHVVLMGHLDTVFDTGTAAARPFRVEGTTAFGPGVTDCKAGVLTGVNAVAALKATGTPFGRITYLLTPDEEIGSP